MLDSRASVGGKRAGTGAVLKSGAVDGMRAGARAAIAGLMLGALGLASLPAMAAESSDKNAAQKTKPAPGKAGDDKSKSAPSKSDGKTAAKTDGKTAARPDGKGKGDDKNTARSDGKSDAKSDTKPDGKGAGKAGGKPIVLSPWCRKVTERLSSVTPEMCQRSSLVASGATSINKEPIMVRRIAAGKPAGDPKSAPEPLRIFLIGGIHGDELTATAIVFRWMQYIPQPQAKEFQWVVAPLTNPDGMFADKPVRGNANGVDLNRNFPTPAWQKEAPLYWSRVTKNDPRRFPGKAPLSEPESRWINAEIERFKPNVIISVHAPFGLLDFDGPAPVPDRFGRLLFNGVGVYPGSLGNYSGRHQNVPVITIELPNAGTMPDDEEVQRIWADMLTWIKRNVHPTTLAGKPGNVVR